MPTLYLKDRLAKTQGQKLTLTLMDRSPGVVNKKKRDGTYYQVHEFKFRIAGTSTEFNESIWPQTTTGKPNPLLGLLNKVGIGQNVVAFLNERGFMDFELENSEFNQDTGFPPSDQSIQSHQQEVERVFSQPTPTPAPPPHAMPPSEHDLILALHGIVQAQLSGGKPDWVILGIEEEVFSEAREGRTNKSMSAEEWVKWIGKKAKEIAHPKPI